MSWAAAVAGNGSRPAMAAPAPAAPTRLRNVRRSTAAGLFESLARSLMYFLLSTGQRGAKVAGTIAELASACTTRRGSGPAVRGLRPKVGGQLPDGRPVAVP